MKRVEGAKMIGGVTGGDDRTLSIVETTEPHGVDIDVPHLVLVMEISRPLAPPRRISLVGVDRVTIGRGPARRVGGLGTSHVSVEVPDGWMSLRHVIVYRDGNHWRVEDAGSKNGTAVGGVRIDSAPLADGDVVEAGGTHVLFRRAVTSANQLADVDREVPEGRHLALTTLSLELQRRLDTLEAVAASEVPILLWGETGTGKELAARAIHERSGRAGALQAVNCGALPRELVESELFGSRRGAFSGATDRRGHVRAATGGTLFLDEIAELSPPAQATLLRVLQEREVVPLGETEAIPVDIRIVAASQHPLANLVSEGRFRADLYARLAGLEIELMPLRRRREDLGLILGSLLHRLAGQRAGELALRRAAARALVAYDWPGNIRELEHALATALAIARDRPLALDDLPRPIRERALGGTALSETDRALRSSLAEALAVTGGNISATSRRLDVSRTQIRRWCKRLGLDPDRFRR